MSDPKDPYGYYRMHGHDWQRVLADEQFDHITRAFNELCPIGRRILMYVADRLVFGVRTKGPWRPKAKTRIDKLEEIADGLIYTAVEAIEDADGGE